MKRYNIIFAAFALMLLSVFASCSEDDNTVEEFPDWQNRNEAYFADIYEQAKANADGTWKLIRSYALEDTIPTTNDDYIAVKVLRAGTGSGCPMFSDSVKVNYRGRLIPSTSYADGYVFDESYIGEYNPATALPSTMYVGGTVDGFATALQHMRIGDYWRVYIPYWLGYGTSGSPSIPAYSTLIYDIELVAYYRAGVDVPDTRAAEGVWITE